MKTKFKISIQFPFLLALSEVENCVKSYLHTEFNFHSNIFYSLSNFIYTKTTNPLFTKHLKQEIPTMLCFCL